MKRIIWSEDINISDWEDENGNPMSYSEAEELNYTYLEDERLNLNKPAGGQIICIADIGLWNGRRKGYKLIGDDIDQILYPRMDCISSNTWYDNGKDICHDEHHHDGSNHYIYRIMKGDTYEKQCENADKLYSKPLTNQRIGIYTKSLRPLVAEIYGW